MTDILIMVILVLALFCSVLIGVHVADLRITSDCKSFGMVKIDKLVFDCKERK